MRSSFLLRKKAKPEWSLEAKQVLFFNKLKMHTSLTPKRNCCGIEASTFVRFSGYCSVAVSQESLNTSLDKKTSSFVNIRFVGVGFRAYVIKKNFKDGSSIATPENVFLHKDLDGTISSGGKGLRFLMLKVGQSALTAYPIPNSVQVYCPKDQQADKDAILLIGDNFQELKQMTAEIKSYKKPDPYKGSGVYHAQRIETDEGEDFENESVFRKVMKKK